MRLSSSKILVSVGALIAEEVGLGKTVEIISLLLHRSNQRRVAIARKDTPRPAVSTIIILPPNLIEQWEDEVFRFTYRFTVYVYSGPPRKSGDGKVIYVPKSEPQTRTHHFLSSDGENDVLILSSYATWTSSHGPRAHWNWMCERCQQTGTDGRPTKKQTEPRLINEGVEYHSVVIECPYQLSGLFERVILDEGHTIRQEDEDSKAINLTLRGEYYQGQVPSSPRYSDPNGVSIR